MYGEPISQAKRERERDRQRRASETMEARERCLETASCF